MQESPSSSPSLPHNSSKHSHTSSSIEPSINYHPFYLDLLSAIINFKETYFNHLSYSIATRSSRTLIFYGTEPYAPYYPTVIPPLFSETLNEILFISTPKDLVAALNACPRSAIIAIDLLPDLNYCSQIISEASSSGALVPFIVFLAPPPPTLPFLSFFVSNFTIFIAFTEKNSAFSLPSQKLDLDRFEIPTIQSNIQLRSIANFEGLFNETIRFARNLVANNFMAKKLNLGEEVQRIIEETVQNGGSDSEALFRVFCLIHGPNVSFKKKTNYQNFRVKKKIAQIFRFLPKDVVLNSVCDVGCGDGDIVTALGEKLELPPKKIIGIDLREPKERHRMNWIYANAEELSECPKSDLVMCFMALHHMPDPFLVLDNLMNLVEDNGYLMIRENDCWPPERRLVIDLQHAWYTIAGGKNAETSVTNYVESFKTYYISAKELYEYVTVRGFELVAADTGTSLPVELIPKQVFKSLPEYRAFHILFQKTGSKDE